VTGVQRRSERSGWKIEWLNAGRSPFEGEEPGLAQLIHRVAVEKGTFRVMDDYAVCKGADVILIDVQTPIDENHVPHYDSLCQVTKEVGKYLQPGTLVIIESTVAPGTTENVVLPILERESGLRAGSPHSPAPSPEIRRGEDSPIPTRSRGIERGSSDRPVVSPETWRESSDPASASREKSREGDGNFYLAFSYERVMPRRLIEYIADFPRVAGGIDEESTQRAMDVYRHIVNEKLTPADVLTAGMAKVVEHAYRDVNIAFTNEVALACERMGVDAFEIRELINARPDRHMRKPGAGVGGTACRRTRGC
jgi:UDP-N-acetyl-D-mannosaminuronate dehydrogenase